MRKMLLAMSASLLAYAAAAQTSTEGTAASEPGIVAAGGAFDCSAGTAAAGTSAESAMPSADAGAQAAVQTALTDAGFTETQVLSTGYVLQAISPNDECMLIVVNSAAKAPGMAEGSQAPADAETASTTGETASGGSAATEEAAIGEAGQATTETAASEESAAVEEAAESEESAATQATAESESGSLSTQASMGTEAATAAFGESSQQITGDLIDAGYTSVRVVDSAYTLVGRAPDGSQVAVTVIGAPVQ